VEIATRFQSPLRVTCNGQTVDGKSIIQLMTLAAAFNMKLELDSEGEDADELLTSLENLILDGFSEK
jgi:phosphocarrier protein